MDVDRVDHVPRIATRHRDLDGHAGGAAEFQHQAISRPEALFRHRKPPETIVAIGIGAGKIGRKFGLRNRKRVADALFQGVQMVDVAGSVPQRDIELRDGKFLAP